jgi:hypothetical protein
VINVVAALAAGAFAVSAAHAAPRAESAMECGVAADMAVVAHSLAREEIQRPQADAIMGRIYDVSESARGKELMKDIIDAAYSSRDLAASADQSASAGGTASGQRFAEELFSTCMRSGGNMDGMLGRRS